MPKQKIITESYSMNKEKVGAAIVFKFLSRSHSKLNSVGLDGDLKCLTEGKKRLTSGSGQKSKTF